MEEVALLLKFNSNLLGNAQYGAPEVWDQDYCEQNFGYSS